MSEDSIMDKMMTPDKLKALTPKDIENLKPDEQLVVKEIISELAATGTSKLLKDLWYSDYEEIPVGIDTFIDDPMYLGGSLGHSIYPFWRKQLKKIFEPGANYTETILTGGIGLGKSTIADIGLAYILYKLLCLKNPQEYYGLNSTATIAVAFFNITLSFLMNNWGN